MACLVLTEPSRLNSQLESLLATWARRCNGVFVVSSRPVGRRPIEKDEGRTTLDGTPQVSVRTVAAGRVEALEVHLEEEGRHMLWPKARLFCDPFVN